MVIEHFISSQEALLTHGDVVSKVAEAFKAVGTSGSNIVALANDKTNIYGLQFHPEVDLTPNGAHIMKKFLQICGFTFTYNLQDRQTKCIEYIRDTVGNRTVLVSHTHNH